MADNSLPDITSQPSLLQLLLRWRVLCPSCDTVHNGYTPCPGGTISEAERAGVLPFTQD